MNPADRTQETAAPSPSTADKPPESMIDHLVESFIDRQRRGERPTMEEYVQRHPHLADEIREVFPALALIEDYGAPSDSTPDTSPLLLPIPPLLGDFRIVREIGRGGMGIVYEAVQQSLGRHVALKVLPTSAQTTKVHLERFRREAQSAARLHHSNIVPVFAVGEQNGVAFYAMQYIRGQTLDAVLAELRTLRGGDRTQPCATTMGALSVAARSLFAERRDDAGAGTEKNGAARADTARSPAPGGEGGQVSMLSSAGGHSQFFRNVAELGAQAADALAYAHGQGLIHRDIKPSNLMLDSAGTLWVTDFGLVKREGEIDLTSPGDLLGTLRYMSPEQLAGKADIRSDVYSLGVSLYELATLKPAFPATDRSRLFDDIRHRNPPTPRQIDGQIPRDLETIILKAIAKEPLHRYATAQKLADDLRRFLADKPVAARRAGWIEHTWRWCRRNRGVAALLGLIGLLLTGVTVASMVAAVFFHEQQLETEKARDVAHVRLWNSLLSQAEARSASRRPGRRFESLEMIREALALADRRRLTEAELLRFRNAVVACLALSDIKTLRTWETLVGSAHGWNCGYDVDSRLARYVRADDQGAVSVRRIEDDAVLADFPARGRPVHVHLSPDGSRLAIHDAGGMNRRLEIWDLNVQPPKLLHEFTGNLGAYVAFTADGSCAAYYVLGKFIRAVDLNRQTARKFDTNHSDYWRPLAYSPDGRYLTRVVVVERDWRVQLLDASDMTSTADLPYQRALFTRARPDSVAFSPDGRMLAAGCDDQRITLFDVESGRAMQVLEGHSMPGVAVAFDPKGRRLYSTDWSNMLRVWDLATGRQQYQLPSRGRIIRPSADGRLVTQSESQDGRLRILHLAEGDEVRSVADPVTRAGGQYSTLGSHFSNIDRVFAVGVNTRLEEPFGGFALIDSNSGDTHAWVGDLDARPFAFLADGSMMTQGRLEIRRWPRRRDGDLVQFGPPETVAPAGAGDPPAVDATGQLMLVRVGQSLFHLRRPKLAPILLRAPFDDARHVAASPDGKWFAIGNHGVSPDGVNALVYDVLTLAIVARMKVEGQCRVGFSQDSRWFWTASGVCRLWSVDGWRPGLTVPGVALAISPSAQIVAVGGEYGFLKLFHLHRHVELATLTSPDSHRLTPHAFTADGARLLAVAEDSRVGLIWDLRRIRRELGEFDLDWNTAPFSDEPPSGGPVRMEVRREAPTRPGAG